MPSHLPRTLARAGVGRRTATAASDRVAEVIPLSPLSNSLPVMLPPSTTSSR